MRHVKLTLSNSELKRRLIVKLLDNAVFELNIDRLTFSVTKKPE